MKVSGSKEKILKRIRKALEQKVAQPFPNIDNQANIYAPHNEGAEMTFAKSFKDLGGHFMYCDDTAELTDALQALVDERGWKNVICWEDNLVKLLQQKKFTALNTSNKIADVEPSDAGITYCEALIARTGTIMVSSALQSGRTLSIFPPVHIVIAFTSQIVNDLKDGITLMKDRYPNQLPSMINFATGPSRTADIEKTLVVGVHGPREVFVFLVDESI